MIQETHLFESTELTVADTKKRADFTIHFDPVNLSIRGRDPQIQVVNASMPKGRTACIDSVCEERYYYIKCSLAADGIKVNNESFQIIARVPIYQYETGEYFEYYPASPVRVPLRASPGERIERARFWVTNEYHEPIDFDGNDWSLTVEIDYVPMMA